jgi:cytidylate kinase
MNLKYHNVTISGKIATGTTTLAKNLQRFIKWKYINAGELQRQYDRKHDIAENERGAILRPDKHEREMEEFAKKTLTSEKNLIYEAWLAGFVARNIPGILRVLLICSEESLRIDRVVNRDNYSIAQAKKFISKREEENINKWKKIYGNYDFWDPEYYDLVIDTFSSGPLETVGKVLDKLGFKDI